MFAVEEILLGAIIKVIFEKISGSVDWGKFARIEGLDSQLKKWKNMLSLIQAVLSDADDKQNMMTAVKQWLNDLQDLAYDLDDVVDEFCTEACRRKLMEDQASTSKVTKLIPTCCTNFPLGDYNFSRRMTPKVKDISSRLENLTDQIRILHLVKSRGKRAVKTGGRFSTCLPDKSDHLFGREKDKEEILKLLHSDELGNDQVRVVPIVGMGGIGKTTLAQMVYNDDSVQQYFDLRAWTCVSDDFDIVRTTKAILRAVASGGCDRDEDLNTLQVQLKKELTNKKFLIVLDDIWNEKYEDWNILSRPFLAGLPGSKILVTTRQHGVASVLSSIPAYNLQLLTDDDSLALLAKHALGKRNFNEHPDLEGIGKSIVRKCKHLPLALKTLGGLLRSKLSPKEWNDVLNNEIWDIGENQSDILPALMLSYHYLPSQIKQCFAYCSIFAKDYEFDKDDLVLLWMAEGFLQESKGKKLMEKVGDSYFDELLSRSFFEESSSNGSRFVMHDLINDLARYVAGDICSRLTDNIDENIKATVLERVHYLSFPRSSFKSSKMFEILYKAGKLRSFLPLPIHMQGLQLDGIVAEKVVTELLLELRCLRVLSFSCYRVYELPNSIGELIHLRYLNLSRTGIKFLPESVSDLCNLQTLYLHDCYELTSLPLGIRKLLNLRHLVISDTWRLLEMPMGFDQLKNLQTLSKVVVSKGSGLKLKDLASLSLLRGELSLMELQNVTSAEEASDAKLKCKSHLDELRLCWNEYHYSQNRSLELDVLNALQPHSDLKILEIEFYRSDKFSSWVGDSSFKELVEVTLRRCENCTRLPSLGQLHALKYLTIEGMHQVEIIGVDFCYFPSIISLKFDDMPKWEKWTCSTSPAQNECQFPLLQRLHICGCPKLASIPVLRLPSLHHLKLDNCRSGITKNFDNLTALVSLKCGRIMGLRSLQDMFVHFPLGLKDLTVSRCEQLGSLWESRSVAQNLVSLQSLRIDSCPQLLSLQELSYCPTLGKLHLSACGALESLPSLCSLKSLELFRCSSLKSLSLHKFSSIGDVEIGGCEKLSFVTETIFEESATSVKRLSVWGCPCLNVGKVLGSAYGFASLSSLTIDTYHCTEALHTPNLESLYLRVSEPSKFGTLESPYFSQGSSLPLFPQGDLPPNLKHISIYYYSNKLNLKPLGEWGLTRLASLESFTIFKGFSDLLDFSSHGNDGQSLLPPTLRTLRIDDLPTIQSLSKLLQNLTALQDLTITDCPKLQCLPKESLSDRLLHLHIYNCPLLEKKCLRDKGEYWPLIQNIPHVTVIAGRTRGSEDRNNVLY